MTNDQLKEALLRLAQDESTLEVARKAIEDVLIDRRDRRMLLLHRGNGLVVREADGSSSHVIRLGPEQAMAIGLRAIAEALPL